MVTRDLSRLWLAQRIRVGEAFFKSSCLSRPTSTPLPPSFIALTMPPKRKSGPAEAEDESPQTRRRTRNTAATDAVPPTESPPAKRTRRGTITGNDTAGVQPSKAPTSTATTTKPLSGKPPSRSTRSRPVSKVQDVEEPQPDVPSKRRGRAKKVCDQIVCVNIRKTNIPLDRW